LDTENIFDLSQKRDRYVALREGLFTNSPEGLKHFSKYFAKVDEFASYYARGGTEYLRDKDYGHFDYSGLRRIPKRTTFKSFEDLSQKAHALNWILIRGKHYKIPADEKKSR